MNVLKTSVDTAVGRGRRRDRRVHRLPRAVECSARTTKPPVRAAVSRTTPSRSTPKRVTYEIFGPAGADVPYHQLLDLSAQPQEVKTQPLPWSNHPDDHRPAPTPISWPKATVTPSDAASPWTTGQGRESSDGVHAETFCLVKSA